MNREAFLENIAVRLGRKRLAAPSARDETAPATVRRDPDDHRVARFCSELEAVGGNVTVADSVSAAADILRDLLDGLGAETIITWDRALFAGWQLDRLWDSRKAISWRAREDEPESIPELLDAAQRADVGVTLADYAIAATGTLVLATSPERARAVSLLPTAHVALLRSSQIVDTLGDALLALSPAEPAQMPSSIHLITGPSRSGDIEGDLSIGVHGPAAVHVILLKDS